MRKKWKVSDFVSMKQRWGTRRTLIGKMEIYGGLAWIGLFKENRDGREFIRVHKTENNAIILRLPVIYVSSEDDKQNALNEIYNVIMSY